MLEDSAQAHGAEWDGRRAGSFGEAACFSFYPAKNLGAFGDAGAVVTSREGLADQVRSLSNHGRSHGHAHYDHDRIGTNSRLDALQAILLSGKLAHLDAWTERRIELAARYRDLLSATEFTGGELKLTATAPLARDVYHLLVVRVARRDSVRAELARRGIQTGVHYPVPCHRQSPLRRFAQRPLPVAEQSAAEVLSLPMFPHMTDHQVDFVCESLSRPCGPPQPVRSLPMSSEPADAPCHEAVVADRDVIVGYPAQRAGERGRSCRQAGPRRRGQAPVRNRALRRLDDRQAAGDRARRRHQGRLRGRRRRSGVEQQHHRLRLPHREPRKNPLQLLRRPVHRTRRRRIARARGHDRQRPLSR